MVEGFVEGINGSIVTGWCFDRSVPNHHVELELVQDDIVLMVTSADRPRADLAGAGIGQGDHGFCFALARCSNIVDLAGLIVRARGSGVRLPRLGGGGNQQPTVGEIEYIPRRSTRRKIPRCLLHIGMEKTGSTSLQRFIGLNRSGMIEHGVLIPRSLSPHARDHQLNHILLAIAAMDTNSESHSLRQQFGISSIADIFAHRQNAGDALAAEIEADGSACHTLLLSSEHCQSRLRRASEVERLSRFLHAFCDKVEIVLYLRPQYAVAVSSYATIVKNGAIDVPILPQRSDGRPYGGSDDEEYNYDRLVQRWENGFGAGNVEVRLYKSDIVPDFMSYLRLDISDFTLARRENVALDIAAEQLMTNINAVLASRDLSAAQRLRETLIEALEATHGGKGAKPSRADVDRFQRQFDGSNERLRARRFAGRDRLFDIDLTEYGQNPSDTASISEMTVAFVDVLNYVIDRDQRKSAA